MTINILASNKCIINLTVSGRHQLTLQSISGIYNPIILDTDDWIDFESFRFRVSNRIILCDVPALNSTLTSQYRIRKPDSYGRFYTDSTSQITVFPEPIHNCSDRFKHIYNLKTFPVSESRDLAQ